MLFFKKRDINETKPYLKIFEIDNDILEEAELICTKVLR